MKYIAVAWMVLAFAWVVGCSYGIYYSAKHPSQNSKVVTQTDNNINGPSITGLPFIVEYAAGIWGNR